MSRRNEDDDQADDTGMHLGNGTATCLGPGARSQ